MLQNQEKSVKFVENNQENNSNKFHEIIESQSLSRKDINRLRHAYNEIKSTCNELILPSQAITTTFELFYQIFQKRVLYDKTYQTRRKFVGACIYAGCRISGASRCLAEICNKLHIQGSKNKVWACFVVVIDTLIIKVPRINPFELLTHFADGLGITQRILLRANEILRESLQKLNVNGKDPRGYVGASLYLALMWAYGHADKNIIATKCFLNTTTLMDRVGEIRKIENKSF